MVRPPERRREARAYDVRPYMGRYFLFTRFLKI